MRPAIFPSAAAAMATAPRRWGALRICAAAGTRAALDARATTGARAGAAAHDIDMAQAAILSHVGGARRGERAVVNRGRRRRSFGLEIRRRGRAEPVPSRV